MSTSYQFDACLGDLTGDDTMERRPCPSGCVTWLTALIGLTQLPSSC